jgi:hypothetical protein
MSFLQKGAERYVREKKMHAASRVVIRHAPLGKADLMS